jgi:hypothetical protein
MNYCNCKNKSPELLEGGNCICTDCKCHYYKRNDDNDDEKNVLQKIIIVIMGTSTLLYGIYILCCENHIHILIRNT